MPVDYITNILTVPKFRSLYVKMSSTVINFIMIIITWADKFITAL